MGSAGVKESNGELVLALTLTPVLVLVESAEVVVVSGTLGSCGSVAGKFSGCVSISGVRRGTCGTAGS
jgi:hypothetical protein